MVNSVVGGGGADDGERGESYWIQGKANSMAASGREKKQRHES